MISVSEERAASRAAIASKTAIMNCPGDAAMSSVACRSCADQHPTPVAPSLPSSTPELPANWPATLVSSSGT
jgi:hypothetical protein